MTFKIQSYYVSKTDQGELREVTNALVDDIGVEGDLISGLELANFGEGELHLNVLYDTLKKRTLLASSPMAGSILPSTANVDHASLMFSHPLDDGQIGDNNFKFDAAGLAKATSVIVEDGGQIVRLLLPSASRGSAGSHLIEATSDLFYEKGDRIQHTEVISYNVNSEVAPAPGQEVPYTAKQGRRGAVSIHGLRIDKTSVPSERIGGYLRELEVTSNRLISFATVEIDSSLVYVVFAYFKTLEPQVVTTFPAHGSHVIFGALPTSLIFVFIEELDRGYMENTNGVFKHVSAYGTVNDIASSLVTLDTDNKTVRIAASTIINAADVYDFRIGAVMAADGTLSTQPAIYTIQAYAFAPGGAPTDAKYVVTEVHGSLSAEVLIAAPLIGDGSVTDAEFQRLDGVTSDIQPQFVAITANDWVTTARIADDAITNALMADDAIDTAQIADSAVETASINAGAVTVAKIGADAVTAAKIGDDVINSEHIAADSIDAEHLNANSVNTDAIIDDAVRTAHIQNAQVTTAKIAGDAITAALIADNAINSEHYTDGSIDTSHFSANCITADEIGDNVINSEHYAAGSIDNEHIADNAIDSEHYADGSIDNAHIADDAIDSEHYAAGSIDTAHIAADQITSALIADNQIDSEHIAADSLDTEHYAAGSVDVTALGADCVTAAKIGDNVLNSEHYAAGSIDDEHLAVGVSALKIANGSVTNTEFEYIATLSSDIQVQMTNHKTYTGTGSVGKPASEHSWSGLKDVYMATRPTNNCVPVWNAANNAWNHDANLVSVHILSSTNNPHGTTVTNLGDTTVPTKVAGDTMVWNGSAWIAGATLDLDFRLDTTAGGGGSPTVKDVLTWNGSKWTYDTPAGIDGGTPNVSEIAAWATTGEWTFSGLVNFTGRSNIRTYSGVGNYLVISGEQDPSFNTVDIKSNLTVTGNITVDGTVDGIDIAAMSTRVTTNSGDLGTHTGDTSTHGVDIIVGTGTSQTLYNKTLVTPTVSSFINATHAHGEASEGGTISELHGASTKTVAVTNAGVVMQASQSEAPDGDHVLTVKGNIVAYGTAATSASTRNGQCNVWVDQGFGHELHYDPTYGFTHGIYGRTTDTHTIRWMQYAANEGSQGDANFVGCIKASNGFWSIGSNMAPSYRLEVSGEVNAVDGFRAGGTAGIDKSQFTYTDGDFQTHTVTIKGGLITEWNIG